MHAIWHDFLTPKLHPFLEKHIKMILKLLTLSYEKSVFVAEELKLEECDSCITHAKLFLALSVMLISMILMLCYKRCLHALVSFFSSITFLGEWFYWIGKCHWLGLNSLPSVWVLIKFSTLEIYWSKRAGPAPPTLWHMLPSKKVEHPSIKIIIKIFKATLISPCKMRGIAIKRLRNYLSLGFAWLIFLSVLIGVHASFSLITWCVLILKCL